MVGLPLSIFALLLYLRSKYISTVICCQPFLLYGVPTLPHGGEPETAPKLFLEKWEDRPV
jgi:hypothetical protein